MTPIEISEKIRDHLINQNAKALNEYGGCRYRGNNGSMCAVGCLITDEVYTPDLECATVSADRIIDALNKSGIELKHNTPLMFMLRNWQQYHDADYGYWLHDPEKHPSPEQKHKTIMGYFETYV